MTLAARVRLQAGCTVLAGTANKWCRVGAWWDRADVASVLLLKTLKPEGADGTDGA
jgi:hypothetical protein